MARKVLSRSFLGLSAMIALAAAVPAAGAAPDPKAVVVSWQGGEMTVEELVAWYGYGTEAERQPLPTLEAKLEFLDPLINAELMIAEAESLGITKLPIVADFVRGRRVAMVTELVQTRATQGRLNVSARDIDDVYRKRLTEMEIKQITVRTQAEALALVDSVKAGVPFEDLARRYSTSPTGENGGSVGTVKWGDFVERWSATAYALEPGEVSQPFQAEGLYFILKSYSKKLVAPPDSAAEKAGIRATMERDLAFKERGAYLDSLRIAYGFYLDVDAAIRLSTKYAIAIAKLGEPTAVVDADITPEVTEAERAVPVVSMRGKALTTGGVIDIIARTPFQVRPRVDDPDEFIPFIVLKANDSLLVAEGEKLGLDKHPDVVAGVGRAYRRKTLYAFYDFITSPAAVPEAEARAFYDANTAYYRVPEGYNISKIVVGNREAADSVITRLEAGEAFADVARARSRDPFTATQGGNVGFLKVGDDEEFDGFLATMQVGEKKVFRSLEGYVVLWLMERHSPRQASFEEARGSVEQRLIQAKKDEILEKWIAERRQAVGVTIDRQVLDQVVFPS